MKITIEGVTAEDLAKSLADMLFNLQWTEDENGGPPIANTVKREMEERYKAAVEGLVKKHAMAFTEARAREVIEEVIAEGVTVTDNYGSVQKRKTWREFVTSWVIYGGDDSYNRKSKIESIARDAVSDLFKTQLKGLLDEVAAQVRAHVDEVVMGKIKEAIRKGAGIEK